MLHLPRSIRDAAPSLLKRRTEMLQFPVATPPAPGETMPIAPGVRWLRMPLPFALNHINLWLLEDGPGWTIVDCGFAGAPTTGLWEQIFAEGLGGRQWRVIIGEGHAPELACPYCAETGTLIAGDQILPKISPNISVPPHEPDGDPLARYLRSLDKLRGALPPDTLVLPSHNLPFRGVHIRIDELAAHHRERCAEVITACERPHRAAELLPIMIRRPLGPH